MRTPMRRIALLVAVLAIMFTIVGSLAGGATPAHACTTGSGNSNPCGGTAPAPAPQDADNGPARCQFTNGATDLDLVEKTSPVQIPAGATIKGAVLVGPSANGPWTPMYLENNDGTVGNVAHFLSDGWAWPKQWGGNASCTRTDTSVDQELMTNGKGCGVGCADVRNVFYQNGKVWEWYTAHNNSPNSGNNTPSPSPAPANTPVQSPVLDCGDNLAVSETRTVPAGCKITGDVVVNGQVLYDHDATTCLLVVLKQDAVVSAYYGASVHSQDDVDDLIHGMWSAGCGDHGCRSVTKVEYPGGKPVNYDRPGDWHHQ